MKEGGNEENRTVRFIHELTEDFKNNNCYWWLVIEND